MSENFKHVFGPVPSRRLGRSLGVDLVPFKTCSYDCIYCQLGRTTCKTVERKEWVPLDQVIHELKLRLKSRPDYITLSGSGEPTLYSRLDELIDAIQIMTNIPVAVLTNGSLLWQPEVRAQLSCADVVIPSLDAGDELRFRAINRPHPRISFDQMVEGLMAFRREYRGQYWLEILLLDGYTALQSEVAKLAEWAKRIQPDKVQLNTCVRPPAEEFALAVSRERLQHMAKLFTPPAEVIAECQSRSTNTGLQPSARAILQLLRRRPCTVEDVARGLAMKPGEAVKLLATLEAQGRVQCRRHDALPFYRLASSRRPLTPRGNPNRPKKPMTTNPSSIRPLRPSSADGDEILANHRQLVERDTRMKGFGYDFAAGVEFVLARSLPLAGSMLEIGTGKGRFMVALAPHVKEMTTVDISEEEQRCARLNAGYTGVKTKIKYVLQDAAHLPWPDQTFDAAVTMNAIHHIPHFFEVLEEMQRVVKPGGKLVLADFSPRGFQIMARFHRSEGKVHEHNRYDFRDFQKLLRNRGWAARLYKGKLQEVLVAKKPTMPSREKGRALSQP